MNGRNDTSQTMQLTATEVASIIQPIASNPNEAKPAEPIWPAFESNRDDVAVHSIANYSFATLASYELISLVKTILDMEHMDGEFHAQFLHYVLTNFWLNISGALFLAAWIMVDLRKSHFADDLVRSRVGTAMSNLRSMQRSQHGSFQIFDRSNR